jgi:hypothetical protein
MATRESGPIRALLLALPWMLLCGFGFGSNGGAARPYEKGSTIYVLGDIHGPSNISLYPEAESLFARAARDPNCKAFVLVGDIQLAYGALDTLGAYLSAAGIPLLAAASNHDSDFENLYGSTTYGTGVAKRCYSDSTSTASPFTDFAAMFSNVNADGYGAVEIGDVLLLFPNTNADTTGADNVTYSYAGATTVPGWQKKTAYHSNADPGVADSTTAQWTLLKATMAASSATHRLAFSGRSWFPTNNLQAGRPPIRTRGRGSMLDMLERYGVRAIFESDPHNPNVSRPIRNNAKVTTLGASDYTYHVTSTNSSAGLRVPSFDAAPDSTFWLWKWGTTGVSSVPVACIYAKLTFNGRRIYVEMYKSRDYAATDSLCYSFSIRTPGSL